MTDSASNNCSLDDIKQIATLAQIAIDDTQAQQLNKDINRILSLMDTLADIDTDDVEPLASPHAVSQPLRADEVTEHNNRAENQAMAPLVEQGLYLVPKVIE